MTLPTITLDTLETILNTMSRSYAVNTFLEEQPEFLPFAQGKLQNTSVATAMLPLAALLWEALKRQTAEQQEPIHHMKKGTA